MIIQDATAAALYLASKIEDTAKRPNQIVCAGYNCNVPPADQRQPEDDVSFILYLIHPIFLAQLNHSTLTTMPIEL
jgi:phosphatidylethanolamine-binding protein (PEBP) family uncharacterized protein